MFNEALAQATETCKVDKKCVMPITNYNKQEIKGYPSNIQWILRNRTDTMDFSNKCQCHYASSETISYKLWEKIDICTDNVAVKRALSLAREKLAILPVSWWNATRMGVI